MISLDLHGKCQVGKRRCNILATPQPSDVYFFPSLSVQTFLIQYIISVANLGKGNCPGKKSHRCPPNSKCKNEPGSFRCNCKRGFKKVGATCKGKRIVMKKKVAVFLQELILWFNILITGLFLQSVFFIPDHQILMNVSLIRNRVASVNQTWNASIGLDHSTERAFVGLHNMAKIGGVRVSKRRILLHQGAPHLC